MTRAARWRMLAGALLAAVVALAGAADAQTRPAELPLGGGLGVGKLYRPQGPASSIAFLNAPCEDMVARGFVCLDVGLGYGDSIQAADWWVGVGQRLKAGVEILRAQPGVTRVVLFGHSGGATIASFYQAAAEAGPAYCSGPEKLSRCDDRIASLPRPDALVLADAHLGFPVALLRNLNPSLSVKDGRLSIDPGLDPFNPANGFNPAGESHYAPAFRARYFAAQAAQMNRLIDQALEIRRRMEAGDWAYPDDDLMVIPGGGDGASSGASLIPLDLGLPGVFTTARPRKLLKNDGTVVIQPIRSVATYANRDPKAPPADERRAAVPDPATRARLNRSFEGVKLVSVRSFLSREAVRATNSLDGIDYCSAMAAPMCAARYIRVPVLVAANGAYKFIGDDERLFEAMASGDRDFIVVEGSLHGFQPCQACEPEPGAYANSRKNLFDYIARWARDRFPDTKETTR